MYFCFVNVTAEVMPVFISILNSISAYIDGFCLHMDKTGLLKVITETTIRCNTGGRRPRHRLTEFKTAVNIIFQHHSEFLTKLILL